MPDKAALKLLFQRPLEPVFTPKGNGKILFKLPISYLTDRYKNAAADIESRFAANVEKQIAIREVPPPDLSFTKPLSRKQQFSLFIDSHMEIAAKLIKIFFEAADVSTLLSIATYARDRINPTLFQYAFSVAMQHRPDTKDETIPNIFEIFPFLFVDPGVINQAREEGIVFQNNPKQVHIDIPENFTASDRDYEHRLAYFREDIGVNAHHWHWHLVYPAGGPDIIVRKDRRGELFYYMHHQILARYNVERFCNQLPRVRPLLNLREPIQEGYFPKILNTTIKRTYPGRIHDVVLKDLEREDNTVQVGDLERWRDRIYEAIDKGYIRDASGKKIPLDPVKGIDILGNIVEASALSHNPQFYGSLHNKGHDVLAFAHDPDNRHLEDMGVMGDVTTAMRDPIFYRWHTFIDLIFQKFKSTLPQYTISELGFDGVFVDSVEVKINNGTSPPNVLATYKQKSSVDLATGLDFGPNGKVYAQFIHSQHAAYTYNIKAMNSSEAARKGTCRIFISPRVDNRGIGFTFSELRHLMIELDTFTVDLKPGENIITRNSEQSSVTIPFERLFQKPGAEDQPKGKVDFCGCGWPQYLLLPRGRSIGAKYDLYVMISDFKDDEVMQGNNRTDACGVAHSFCGMKDKLYPDKRTMGFPFDRPYEAQTLEEFISPFKNMKTVEITINFENVIKQAK